MALQKFCTLTIVCVTERQKALRYVCIYVLVYISFCVDCWEYCAFERERVMSYGRGHFLGQTLLKRVSDSHS
jgi:hypothetical protein